MVRIALRCMTGIALASAAMYGAYTVAVKSQVLSINPTTSLTPGIYVRTFQRPVVGDIVKFKMPPSMIKWLESHGAEDAAEFFSRPENGLIKTVVAENGDIVCVIGDDVNVNGTAVGTIFHGMLEWKECRPMGPDELFVMTPTKDGIDSRMYGPILRKDARTYALLFAAKVARK